MPTFCFNPDQIRTIFRNTGGRGTAPWAWEFLRSFGITMAQSQFLTLFSRNRLGARMVKVKDELLDLKFIFTAVREVLVRISPPCFDRENIVLIGFDIFAEIHRCCIVLIPNYHFIL